MTDDPTLKDQKTQQYSHDLASFITAQIYQLKISLQFFWADLLKITDRDGGGILNGCFAFFSNFFICFCFSFLKMINLFLYFLYLGSQKD